MNETDAFGRISNKALTPIRNQEQDWLSAWLSQSVIEESLMEMKCEVCGGNLFRSRKSTFPSIIFDYAFGRTSTKPSHRFEIRNRTGFVPGFHKA